MLYQPQPDQGKGVEQAEDDAAAEQETKLGRMSFVDLAGSERAQRTGNVGVRLKWVAIQPLCGTCVCVACADSWDDMSDFEN